MATYSDYNKQITDLLAQQPAQNREFQTGLETQYGLGTSQADLNSIRKSAMETDKMLADLPTQLKQRTGGMLMTAGQLGRVQASEQAPLAQTLANLNRRESVASTGVQSIQQMINDALARRQTEQNTSLSELQNQRNLAFQSEEADRQRQASAALAKQQNDWSYLDTLLNPPTTTPTDTGDNTLDTDKMNSTQIANILKMGSLNPATEVALRLQYNIKLNQEKQQTAKQTVNNVVQPKVVMSTPSPLISNVKKPTIVTKPAVGSTSAISKAVSSYLSPKPKPLTLKK